MGSRLGDVEGQLSENTQIIKALVHRTDELDAKFDGLLHTVVTKEAIASMATKDDLAHLVTKEDLTKIEARLDRIEQNQLTQGESINILALRQLQQDSEIALLKKAK